MPRRRYPEPNQKVDDFLAEVIQVCRKHGLSITHEDGHGAFLIETFSETAAEWLLDAHNETGSKEP